MGKRYKEKQLAAQAGRRRAVLQIDRVSRRENNETPSRAVSVKREVNPNSVTGIGLLGVYGENSSDEEEEPEPRSIDTGVGSSVAEDEERKPCEMDDKLADFFKEIESIDPDAAPSSTEGQEVSHRQPSLDGISSTSELGQVEMQVYDTANGDGLDEQGGEVLYPWQMCLDDNTNCYYYWNTETNEVRWDPPPLSQPDVTTSDNGDTGVLTCAAPGDIEDVEELEEENKLIGPLQPDSLVNDMEDLQPVIGPSLPPEKSDQFPESKGQDDVAVSTSTALVEYQDTRDDTCPATPPDSQSGDELDGYEVVDTWEEDDQLIDTIDGIPLEVPVTKETTVEKNIEDKNVSVKEEQDSDDEFAAMLLEDTYHKGKKESVKNERATPVEELNSEEVCNQADDHDGNDDADDANSQLTPLLPPSVFEHLKASSATEKIPSQDVKAEDRNGVSAVEEDSGEEEKFRQRILDLSATITNKLNFLEISREGISNLQVLCIEVETRIKDWREGGLTSAYLVHKLEEADLYFKQYEESAAPPGWTCKWHRTHKRYFYTNNADGESQWDYPLVSSSTTTMEEPAATTSTTEGITSASISSVTPVATMAVTTAETSSTTAAVHTVSVPAWGSTAQVYVPTLPSAAIPVHGTMQASVMEYSLQAGLPLVSTVPTAAIYHNPPVPGTDSSLEAVPFSLREEAEEPPPPPPGTDEPPPLPSGNLPPPPPPEPADEKPPPPPGEESSVASFSSSRQSHSTVSSSITTTESSSMIVSGPQTLFPPRSLIDYSDLDNVSSSPLPSNVTSSSAELVTNLQPTGIEQVSSGQGSGTSSPVPMVIVGATKSKTKKRKSTKLGSTLSSKARKVSSLVQKWQSIKVEEPEIESEEEEEIDPEVVSQKQIEQWKFEQMTSGQAAYNPNFEEIKGDWRERLLKKKQKTGISE